jgi:transcriptional regulator with XRE-family HTH domain
VIRAIRRRQEKRQIDVAVAAGCSTATVSRIEHGLWAELAFGRILAVADVIGVRLDVTPRWRGAELDRVIDEGHARLLGLVAGLLPGWGWEIRIEVTYSEFGERGSIDLLAWHAETATLVVFEIKTELGAVEGLLRPLNAKVRLASTVAQKQFGWRPAIVAVIVVFPESVAVRRQVARHETVLRGALPATSRELRTWLRNPAGSMRGIWFLSNLHGTVASRNPSAVRRVRGSRMASSERGTRGRAGCAVPPRSQTSD